MSTSLRDKFFFIIVFCVIFTQIPHIIRLNFIGSFLGKDLSIYPIIAAFAYYIWIYKKEKRLFRVTPLTKTSKIFAVYIIVYIITVFTSFVHGLSIYPYYEAILAGPVNQIEKLPMAQRFLQNLGVSVSEQSLLIFWIFARSIKNVILECFWFFSVPLLIYYWFKRDAHRGVEILCKATICAVTVVCFYGILDIFYLSGSTIAESILIHLNPIVHAIKTNGTWWPPLLLKGQLRSLFAEPSYYGIFAAFAMPWIWYSLLRVQGKRKKILGSMLLFVFLFELFLTKARTANALFYGELAILVLITLWHHKKEFIKNTLTILILSFLAFVLATFSMGYMPGSPSAAGDMGYGINGETERMGAYLDDNLGSLGSSTQRSNRSRYSILKANIAIGEAHPILGVGKGLRSAYVPDYLPEEAFMGEEIQRWIQDQKVKGIMKAVIPELGEYSTRFAETGFLGLLVFLLPSIYLFIKLFRKVISPSSKYTEKDGIIFFFLSWSGTMASGIGDELNITCCYWILMGIGYAIILPSQMNCNRKSN